MRRAKDAAAIDARNEVTAAQHYFKKTCGMVFGSWKGAVQELREENQRLAWESEKLKQVLAWLPPL
jgi:regulator of replication initiation timing